MTSIRTSLNAALLLALGIGAASILAIAAQAAPAEKVTICHAAGQDDTTHFVEITASYNAIYGQSGHFYEPGSPAAGHEQDYEGPCDQKPEPPKDEDPKATPL